MKQIKYYIYKFALLIPVLALGACNDWLDISPRTEIKSDDNFSSEQGYKDALTGVYILMTDQAVYGKEMTFGMVDVLAQYYTGIGQSSHSYYNDMAYQYKETSCENRINAIWSKGYNVIANINELIDHIDQADQRMFTGRNYHLIRGEAYGLRAFVHFDLLRLFGKSYKADPTAQSIPYVMVSGKDVTPLSTVGGILDKALADLVIAEQELLADPVISGSSENSTDDTSYQRDRTFKFNYYAVKMLQARIYLYKGDYTAAARAAKTIIGQDSFTWVPESEISTSDPAQKNYVFSEELVFSLYISGLRDLYTASFSSNSGLYMTEESYDALYETDKYGAFADYRYIYQTESLSDIRVCTKLKQPENGNSMYLYRMPLMRISEAYYIAAECALLQDNDVSAAAGYLNTVRSHRGLNQELSENAEVAEMEDEVYKEYAKEYCCEGQLFYYFKRKNLSRIPVRTASNGNISITYVTPDYVLPLPDDEFEYGGRTLE